ncbi:MAG: hypothetical protein A3B68_02730 [Candidatus Melainabacteria bacterium RIFCSPHIGHO2_02_FULL_34_12]|nr:MAG: hypothetical protein A3B68_02730 [Candidatus Melainabacteria bacterium RIFCSPHIGHO2_02_FULL_34_12]
MNFKKIFLTLAFSSLLFLNSYEAAYAYSDEKPLFVEISTDWCFACKLLKPTIEELKNEYAGSVTFIKLNLTDEESTKEAEYLAKQYGLSDFLNANRNAFPRVAIFCTSGLSPEKNLLGSQPKEIYKESLNYLISNTYCNLSSNFKLADLGPGRPNESQEMEVIGGRPEEVVISGRPDESNHSGRPNELKFWTYGQPVSALGYYIISRCSGDNQILCSNVADVNNTSGNKPQFKPYNPNTTRNEKGFNQILN